MDLLLHAERTLSNQKAFISHLGLILRPGREEWVANEYRGGPAVCILTTTYQWLHGLTNTIPANVMGYTGENTDW
ncbi:hypothetical protein ATANTOWER_031984 [Ataeniobius toweri]|uniref:Uncharacterized protein n=1 Tax=Ataeniobius toweri TaxID=208326 RepID=A0ABU7CDU7_9TELE|nr:hypothetical protein [Ataeniobius toweri]